MDRAEAIKALKGHKTTCLLSGIFDVEESLDMAIAALREQEKLESNREHLRVMEQGCEYCNEYKSLVEENGDFISLDETGAKGVFLEACTCDVTLEVKVPYCPMCGRKLPEPPKEGADG